MAGPNQDPNKPAYPVIEKAYELTRWAVERIQKFPRGHRVGLGDRMQHRLYRVLELLLEARYTKERAPILDAANMDLEVLRIQIRMAHDLRCLSTDQYGFAARLVNEIGGQVGGWKKASPARTPG